MVGFVAVGDHLFKLPVEYTTRVFMNAADAFKISTPLTEIIPRIITPPYLSAEPDVHHVALKSAFQRREPVDSSASVAPGDPTITQRRFLILCSDGLTDLYQEAEDPSSAWAGVVGRALLEAAVGDPVNPALDLLRASLGGSDPVLVSRMLTVEMTSRWMDDTTILVVPL